MTDLYRGWMMMFDVGGGLEPCRKPAEDAANWHDAYSPFIKGTEAEALALAARDHLQYLNDLDPADLARLDTWEPSAIVMEVSVSDEGEITGLKDRSVSFTADEIYEIARMDKPCFTSAPRTA
jgi:hypothetical protein